MSLPSDLSDLAAATAAPEAVQLAFARLGESESAHRLRHEPRLAAAVAEVVAASRSLTRLIVTDPAALDVISMASGLGGGMATAHSLSNPLSAESPNDLVRRKALGYLAIATADLTGHFSLEDVGAGLSALADGVLTAACRLAGVGSELAVIAMGKHGACELNYASDVDIIFVGDDTGTLARRVLGLAGAAYRVDTDLRPEGRSGSLVRSLESFASYWERWAKPWEFQALIKARACAGDSELGSLFTAAASRAIWGHSFSADDLAGLRAMKGRAEQIIERKGLEDREIKRGRGGIRDIEFSVQLLQLVHGASDEAIRTPATLNALAELASAGYIDRADASSLALGYRFLRTVEHRLQLVEEAQVHTVPADADARHTLARVLGFTAEGDPSPEMVAADSSRGRRSGRTAEDRMTLVLQRHQSSARAIHERLFFRPLLEVFAVQGTVTEAGSRWTREAAESRLQALGFRQADRTHQALDELTRGLTRSSRLMQQLLPVLLGWLSETPDPDQGLLSLRTLVSVAHRRDILVAAFRESPELARRLCVLLGTSRQVGQLVSRHPQLAVRLGDNTEFASDDPAELLETAVLATDPGRAASALRRVVEAVVLRIVAADLLGGASAAQTCRALAALGDAAVAGALHASGLRAGGPQVPMGIIAVGRLGGQELSYGSDLDVLVVYDGSGAEDAAAAEEAAAGLFRLLNGPTPAERIWTIDASLRPWGKQGDLARSLSAYEEYYKRYAETWERQALLRARPLAGSPAVLDRFMAIAEEAVWGADFGAEEVRKIRQMKARTERERVPSGEDPQFHLKLGKGSLADVEWTAQLLQLQHGVRSPNTLEALRILSTAGHLDTSEATVLAEAYRVLTETRNRWHLVGNFVAGGGGVVSSLGSDSLPSDRDSLWRLARSLDSDPTELREAYRRVTRRARRVVEERFYGLGDP